MNSHNMNIYHEKNARPESALYAPLPPRHRTLARLNPRGNDVCFEMDAAAIPEVHPGVRQVCVLRSACVDVACPAGANLFLFGAHAGGGGYAGAPSSVGLGVVSRLPLRVGGGAQGLPRQRLGGRQQTGRPRLPQRRVYAPDQVPSCSDVNRVGCLAPPLLAPPPSRRSRQC